MPRVAESERAWQRYEEDVRLRIVPAFGRTPLARLTAQQVQTVYTAKLGEGLAPGTVAHVHAVLRRALGEAQRLGPVQRNVATLVKAPRPAKHEMHTLTPEEARRLLEVATDDRLEALYMLALTTGMRRGELLALHWTDVDLEDGYVQVRYTLQHLKDDAYTFASPKTEHSRRKVSLTATAIATLRRRATRQLDERALAGPAWQEENLVFTNALGGPLRANHVLQRQFAPLLRRVGLPLIRFHDLRHTAATLIPHAAPGDPSQDRRRDAGALDGEHDARHLLARHPGHAARRDGRARPTIGQCRGRGRRGHRDDGYGARRGRRQGHRARREAREARETRTEGNNGERGHAS
jgi:integrase